MAAARCPSAAPPRTATTSAGTGQTPRRRPRGEGRGARSDVARGEGRCEVGKGRTGKASAEPSMRSFTPDAPSSRSARGRCRTFKHRLTTLAPLMSLSCLSHVSLVSPFLPHPLGAGGQARLLPLELVHLALQLAAQPLPQVVQRRAVRGVRLPSERGKKRTGALNQSIGEVSQERNTYETPPPRGSL